MMLQDICGVQLITNEEVISNDRSHISGTSQPKVHARLSADLQEETISCTFLSTTIPYSPESIFRKRSCPKPIPIPYHYLN